MNASLEFVSKLITTPETHLIMAVNPEKVISAQNDPDLLEALNAATLIIPDGIGVVLATRFLTKNRLSRVPGADLMPELCRQASEQGHKVFLFGAKPNVAKTAANILKSNFPGLCVVGVEHGYVEPQDMDSLVARINASGTDILFVALGSPRQEIWMNTYKNRLSGIVCQGVGGSFDALCGDPPRAPALLRRIHLEWLYRLATQPKRALRQFALPRFAFQVAKHVLIKNR